jgi:hypothetical protein
MVVVDKCKDGVAPSSDVLLNHHVNVLFLLAHFVPGLSHIPAHEHLFSPTAIVVFRFRVLKLHSLPPVFDFT